MPDREKVIEALETCRDQDNPPGYRFTSCVDDCPYHGNGCARKLKEDALALLKEQEEIIQCKDCYYYHKPEYGFTIGDCTYRTAWYQVKENEFCSLAKRKEGR